MGGVGTAGFSYHWVVNEISYSLAGVLDADFYEIKFQ